MENRITSREMLPGVWMLTDRMGMHMTLLTGREKALLVDTGYGFDDLKQAVRDLTSLPCTVVCTHGHHDHACGNFQFDRVFLLPGEIPVCKTYAGGWRERVWSQAEQKGVFLSDWQKDDFLRAGPGNPEPLSVPQMDLGGLTARFLPMPGHTPGSMEILVPERRLLLPGDNFNETTWLFFPEAEGMATYRRTLEKMLALDFDFVLPPHNDHLFTRADVRCFYEGTEKETLCTGSVPSFSMWPGKQVMTCHPAGRFTFSYDGGKLPPDWKKEMGLK